MNIIIFIITLSLYHTFIFFKNISIIESKLWEQTEVKKKEIAHLQYELEVKHSLCHDQGLGRRWPRALEETRDCCGEAQHQSGN